MKFQFLFLLFSLFLNDSFAQKYLQMEKINSTKVWKWGIGDEITYQLAGEKNNWHTDVIEDINFENNMILIANGKVNLKDITQIRFKRKTLPYIGAMMMTFGLTSTVFDAISLLLKRGGGYFIQVGPIFFVTGWLIRTFFKNNNFKIGKKYRLRTMDLTLVPAVEKV